MGTGLLVLWFSAFAADGVSTTMALRQPGLVEGNPAMAPFKSNVVGLNLANATAAVGLWVILDRLHDNHPKLAKGLALTIAATKVSVAAHNIRVIVSLPTK